MSADEIVAWLREQARIAIGRAAYVDPIAHHLRAAADTIAALTAERDTLRQQYADADRDLSAEIARRAVCERERDRLREESNEHLDVILNTVRKLGIDMEAAFVVPGKPSDVLVTHVTAVVAERDRLRGELDAQRRHTEYLRGNLSCADAECDRLREELREQERELAELHEQIAEAAGDPCEATSDHDEDGAERASPEQCLRILSDAMRERDRLAAQLAAKRRECEGMLAGHRRRNSDLAALCRRLEREVAEAKSLLTSLRTWMSSSGSAAYLYHGPAFGPRIDAFLGQREG